MLNTQRHDGRVCRQAGLLVESLDDRLLLSVGAPGAAASAAVAYQPAIEAHRDNLMTPSAEFRDRPNAELSLNFARALRLLYRVDAVPGDHSALMTRPPVDQLMISGARVTVVIKVAFPPALNGYYMSDLRADGLRVIRTVPADGLVEGTLPIAKLRAIASLAAHVWPYYDVNPLRHASK